MAMAMVTTGGGLLLSRMEVERNFIIGAVIKEKNDEHKRKKL